jgi:hypothetical protein
VTIDGARHAEGLLYRKKNDTAMMR